MGSGGNLGSGPPGQNPSCLGTLLGPAAHPSLGALRALQLGLRPNKIVEEGGVCAMVTASHSLCSCFQANFYPPYAHPIKQPTDLKPFCDEGYRLTGRCGHCICSHINILEKEIDCMAGFPLSLLWNIPTSLVGMHSHEACCGWYSHKPSRMSLQ